MNAADYKDGAFLRAFDSKVVELMTELGADLSRLDEVAVAAAVLQSDTGLRNWLVERGIDVVELPATRSWVDVRGPVTSTALHDDQPEGRTRKLIDLIAQDADLANRLTRECRTNEAARRVRQVVDDAVQPGRLPTREAAASIRKLLPLIAERAYQAGARATMLSASLQASIADTRDPVSSRNALRLSWVTSMAAGQMFLLSSERRSRDWLLEMSATLDRRTWTPSHSLVRTRSAWLCAVSARCAAAFGSAAVDRYVERLRVAAMAIDALDAVFGLAAIAVGEPVEAGGIERVLTSVLEPGAPLAVDPATVAEYVSSALTVLSGDGGRFVDAVHRRLGWGAAGGRGLATASALKSDASQPDGMGFVTGFGVICTAVRADIEDFFPTAWTTVKGRTVGLTDADLQALRKGVARAEWQ